MEYDEILRSIHKGLIVSCQALYDEPLYGSHIMAKMAIAARDGGAAGIRANYGSDIKAIKEEVDLPVIGLVKKDYDNSDAYITPTMQEVEEVVNAGAEIVAIDATDILKPGRITSEELIGNIRDKFDIMILADVSTYDEAVKAEDAGAHMVSTTLSGYTPHSPKIEGPDFELIERAAKRLEIPVIGEGRIWTPDEARRAFELGAYAIVVGSAITRPREITERFVNQIKSV